MPRRLKYAPERLAAEATTNQAADALAAFVGAGKKRRKPQVRKDKAREELQSMIQGGSYEGAKPMHLVALYEWAHERVYAVKPEEFRETVTWKLAVFAAARLLKDQFEGDVEECVSFMRWVWRREAAREQRRKARQEETRRISWRFFFSNSMVTDYRVDQVRKP